MNSEKHNFEISENDILVARKTLIDMRWNSGFVVNSDGHLLYIKDKKDKAKWLFGLDDLDEY